MQIVSYFCAMKKSQPQIVFELQSINLRGKRYPRREVYVDCVGLFWTKEEAEEAMRARINEEKAWCAEYGSPGDYYDDVLCHYIREVRVCHKLTPFRDCALNRWYSYTADGVLNDYIDVDENGKFHGRKEEDIHFHEGDIVEIIGFNDAELAIVYGTPPTCEWVQERHQWAEQHHPDWPFMLDDTDDSYTVLYLGEGDTHDHPNCVCVFKPTHRVAAGTKARLQAKLKEIKELWS